MLGFFRRHWLVTPFSVCVCDPETPSSYRVTSRAAERLGPGLPPPPPSILGAAALLLSPLSLLHLTHDHGLFSIWLFLISFFLVLRLLSMVFGGGFHFLFGFPAAAGRQHMSCGRFAPLRPFSMPTWLPKPLGLFPGPGPGGSISSGALFPAFLLPGAE